jgi:hypothetical protein
MPFVSAAIAAGGAIAGGALGMSGASKQANAALQGTEDSLALQKQEYNQNRADQAPWRQAGGQAVSTLSSMVEPGGSLSHNFGAQDFQTDPGYDFRLQQGQQALDRSAAAKGNLFSGGTLKANDQYNQGFASNEYQNAYNRFQENRGTQYNQLAGLAGMGQTSVAQTGAAGSQYGANAGNTMFQGQTQAANAQAAGLGAMSQGINQGINSGLNWYQLSQMNQQPPSTNGPYSTGGWGSKGTP